MGEGRTGGDSDIVKVESSGEDSKATGGLVSNFSHPRVNKTKQHIHKKVMRVMRDSERMRIKRACIRGKMDLK